MKTISFYDYGLEDIVLGRKTSTIRLKESFPPGSTVKLTRQDGTHVGYLLIISCKKILFGEIGDEIAKVENWTSSSEIKARLLFSYPELKDESELFHISFKYSTENRFNFRTNKKSFIKSDKITIVSSSKFKYDRYSKVLKNLGFDCDLEFPTDHEDTTEPSCETRARNKLKHIKRNSVTFATDDMLILSYPEKSFHITNISNWEELKKIINSNCIGEAILKTAFAIHDPHTDETRTTVVYRSFGVKPNPSSKQLNDHLLLNNIPLSDLSTEVFQESLNDLSLGIVKLLNGEI